MGTELTIDNAPAGLRKRRRYSNLRLFSKLTTMISAPTDSPAVSLQSDGKSTDVDSKPLHW